ncbi:MAG: ethanolamine utilization protein EutP [Eubacterium sp.]|nr:ethanolamine utilization protein EutP [Eubacterium sp.]
MRKIMFVGRSEAGKTTIMQAMKGDKIVYHKTQYINHYDVVIDTPGEYAETKELSSALAIYGCEADVIGLLMSATEPYSLYPPNIVSVSNREVIGVVTKIDHWAADPAQAAEWLRIAGCKRIFYTSAYTGEGIAEIMEYLKEPIDVLPWEEAKAAYDELGYGPGESAKMTLRMERALSL